MNIAVFIVRLFSLINHFVFHTIQKKVNEYVSHVDFGLLGIGSLDELLLEGDKLEQVLVHNCGYIEEVHVDC